MEGTAAGLAVTAALAGAVVALGVIRPRQVPALMLAATLANYADSVAGAAFQGRPGAVWLTNDAVNLICMAVAAGAAVLLAPVHVHVPSGARAGLRGAAR